RRKRDWCAAIDSVADEQAACADDGDDIASNCTLDRTACAAKRAVQELELNRASGPEYGGAVTGLNASTADSEECDSVPMPRIHVRLHLEHEGAEVPGQRAPLVGVLPNRRGGGRRELDQS